MLGDSVENTDVDVELCTMNVKCGSVIINFTLVGMKNAPSYVEKNKIKILLLNIPYYSQLQYLYYKR